MYICYLKTCYKDLREKIYESSKDFKNCGAKIEVKKVVNQLS